MRSSCSCSGFCNHFWFLLSSPTPSQLVMATQDLVAVSSPRCDHPGRLLSLACSYRSAPIGGICCTVGFRGNSFLFAWSTLVQVLVLSNRSLTNLSIMFTASSGISFGPYASINSASVCSSSYFHVDHAVFFPCPAKLDTVSQHVKAWNIGRAHDISGPRLTTFWLATM